MSDRQSGMSCQTGCWALAAGVALVTFVMLLVAGGQGFIASVFLAGVAFLFLGFLFSWMFCTPLTMPGGSPATVAARPASSAASAPKPASEPAPSAKAETASTASRVAAAPRAADAEAGAKVKPSKNLAGQSELASRKGDWKYSGGDGTAAAKGGTAMTAGAAAGADKEAATKASLSPDAPAEKPATLNKPRKGGADDLKKIKGVGPKLETMLNDMGFYHFDQIANWSDAEVNWVNQNLTGFKGRVTRDDWVAQAKTLASGGETEFSSKVDKGDVY